MSDLVGNPEDRFSRVEAHTCPGFKVAKKLFREKVILISRKFGRNLVLNFRFAYIFYIFSPLPQLKIGRIMFI